MTFTQSFGAPIKLSKWLPYLPVGHPVTAIEIGSYEGESTVWLLEHVLTHPDSRIICIDPFDANPEFFHGQAGNYYSAFLKNTERFGDKVVILRMCSQNAFSTLDSYLRLGEANLAYVDGDHAPAGVLRDAEMVAPYLKDGGLLVFDDVQWVADAARIFLDRNPFESVLRDEHQWLMRRKGGHPPLEFMQYALLDSPEPEWNREEGIGWPKKAYSMIGRRRMANIRDCVETLIRENIAGDLAECGVWRGGASIFMRAILKEYGQPRTVFVCDSFQGFPKPVHPLDPDWTVFPELAVSQDEVKTNFNEFGLLDDQVIFLKGWFRDTLPGPIEKLALLRLDGDLYESTMDCLTALYPKCSSGGYVIVDDYYGAATPMCKQAVDDYREQAGITVPLTQVDWCACYWRKE